MSDVLRLLPPAEAEHRVEAEGVAAPRALDRYHLDVEGLPLAWARPRHDGLVDRPEPSLRRPEAVDLAVVAELAGPGAEGEPVMGNLSRILGRAQLGLERGGEQQVRRGLARSRYRAGRQTIFPRSEERRVGKGW